MFRSWRRLATACSVPLLLATACSSEVHDASSEEALDYRSTAGQEFSLSTELTFEVPEDVRALDGRDEKETALLAHAEQLRTTATNAITAELDRLWPEDDRTSKTGVVVQYRQGSAKLSDLKEVDGGTRFRFTVSAEFAGFEDLERRLPMRSADGQTFLPVSADLGAGSVELRVFVTPIERSLNAYPHYLELFEDGLDISVHVGDDHNDPPKDIAHARSIYDDLLASGFRSPVSTFEALEVDSGPLASSITVKGKDVPVRVRLFHRDMTTPSTRDRLVDAFKGAMKTADVVIYDGHAGRRLDYSGVVLAYKPARVSIPASEFKNIASTDKQQVYLFNGCETYTGYADKLYENPKRTPANTDVITTGNYSAIQTKANQVLSFIHSLIDQPSNAWVPRSWDSVLSRMNSVGDRSWPHVYGVHGIDDDPKVSPLADPSRLGAKCASDADCSAADSLCVTVSSTRKACGIGCADDVGCPAGTRCVVPKGRTSVDDLQCFPR